MNKKTKALFEEFGLPDETADDFFKGLDEMQKQLVVKKVKRGFVFVALASFVYMFVYGAFLLGLVAGAFWLWKAFFGA